MKYEYKLLKKLITEQELIVFEFNKLGEEGWEMCGVVRGDLGVVYIFKRAIK